MRSEKFEELLKDDRLLGVLRFGIRHLCTKQLLRSAKPEFQKYVTELYKELDQM